MSALAGVLWLDGRPAASCDVETLLGTMSYRAPDGEDVGIDGPAALGIAYLHTTCESRQTRQPWIYEPCAVHVTFDGRLDNRAELAAACGVERDAADAVLVAHAFACWGEDMASRVLGDFALVVWDSRRRTLFAARDVMGIHPFHYQLGSRSFRWASDAHPLVRTSSAPVNQGMLGEMLADQVTSTTDTLFDGVLRLPPAHALTLRDGTLRTWRYWEPQPRASAIPDEWDDELRALVTQSVRARLRADRPVALLLSGGIDSTIVAATARATGAATGIAACHTFSLTLPDHAADERPFFESVARAHALPSTVVPAGSVTAKHVAESAGRDLLLPEAPTSLIARPMRATIASRGHRVVLTGAGGDEWFAGTQMVAADYLARREWSKLLARIRDDRQYQAEYTPARLVSIAVWRLLTPRQRDALRRVMRKRATPSWINPVFAARVALEDRLRAAQHLPQLPSYAATETLRTATSGDAIHYLEATSRVEASWGVEVRHPFYDRRIIEFALALPNEERLQRAKTKAILRRAFQSQIPNVVHNRPPSPDYSFVIPDTINALGGRHAVEHTLRDCVDYVRPGSALALYEAMIAPHRDRLAMPRAAWPLWLMFAVHFWQQATSAAGAFARRAPDGQQPDRRPT